MKPPCVVKFGDVLLVPENDGENGKGGEEVLRKEASFMGDGRPHSRC